MRRAPFLVMLLLLFCAGPLLAQSPGVIPMPQQSKAKLAKKHLKHKAVATKPAATKSAKTKSAASKPAEPKPVRRRRAAGKSPATGKPGMVKNAIEARKAKEAKAEPAKTKTEAEAKPEAPSDVFAGTPQGERQKIQDALGMVGRLYRHCRRRRFDAHRDQEFPEAPQGQSHRHPRAVRARRPPRRRQAARGRIRLERGGRSGDRHPHRPADQAGDAGARRRSRHALVIEARRGAGRDLPHQGRQPQARRPVRKDEKRTGHAQGRDQRAA